MSASPQKPVGICNWLNCDNKVVLTRMRCAKHIDSEFKTQLPRSFCGSCGNRLTNSIINKGTAWCSNSNCAIRGKDQL